MKCSVQSFCDEVVEKSCLPAQKTGLFKWLFSHHLKKKLKIIEVSRFSIADR